MNVCVFFFVLFIYKKTKSKKANSAD